MSYFNQLNIITLPDMERSAVSVGNLKKYDNCYNSAGRMPKFYAYGSTTCGNNDVYAIYYGMAEGDIAPETEQPVGTTIHVITFDGTVRKYLPRPNSSKAYHSTKTLLRFMASAPTNVYINMT